MKKTVRGYGVVPCSLDHSIQLRMSAVMASMQSSPAHKSQASGVASTEEEAVRRWLNAGGQELSENRAVAYVLQHWGVGAPGGAAPCQWEQS